MIISIIGQEGGGFDTLLYILLPVFCCLMSMNMGQRRDGSAQQSRETESWYTVQDIETTYAQIEEKVEEWHDDSKIQTTDSGSFMTTLRKLISGKREPDERFVTREKNAPRLYSVSDTTGPIYFELTEVNDGGTVVKTSYNLGVKEQMARFKAELPLSIPSTPIGLNCPSCGKPVLEEFELCPYCGEKLIKE
jgi:hypothetical protein